MDSGSWNEEAVEPVAVLVAVGMVVVVVVVVIRVRVKAVVQKAMMKMSHKRLAFEDDCFWIVEWRSISFVLFIS